MQTHNIDSVEILREKAIQRYISALDQGDIVGIATVLEAAMVDPELDRLIVEVNLAYQEEYRISTTVTDVQIVREILHKHLPSAFEPEEDPEPLTIGEVVAQLQAERRVSPSDKEASRVLSGSSVKLPVWLSSQTIKRLAVELGVNASERFWRVFRDTAIMMGMGRSHTQAKLDAAREERAKNAKSGATHSGSTKPFQEDANQDEAQ